MSFFDRVKEEYKKAQEKTAELNEIRGKKLAKLGVEYLGGFDDYTKSSGSLVFFQKRIEFNKSMNEKKSFIIENSKVSDVAVEGRQEVNRRVTVTRLLTIGIFAFAAKKKSEEKEAYITIILKDGQEVVFKVPDKSPFELKPKLASAISVIKTTS
jgi:hypothetical protein